MQIPEIDNITDNVGTQFIPKNVVLLDSIESRGLKKSVKGRPVSFLVALFSCNFLPKAGQFLTFFLK